MIDMHVHTSRCRHASGTPSEYVAAAEAAGVSVLAFTDHLPLLDGSDTDYAMSMGELPAYVAEIGDLRGSEARSEILLGIEADWDPCAADVLREALARYDFDVVLGSVHFLGGWAFDDPRLVGRYATTDVDALWRDYFGALAAAARSGLFDIMAHIDLVKKFGYMPSYDPRELYEDAALAFARAGVAVEVNTAGLRKPCAELYPTASFLRACRSAGVLATMGSDAHAPEEVGMGLGQARDALVAAGYDSVVVFRGRVPEERGL
jgi:histidinol-phosphatase (PHP family)